ncbi:uncharacterized protein BJX67DRAFT_115262 [Aspergillus lucknowensis]|uniref:Uncharacterized protein n=1 Tax=Aspergillus lucknowensis TaxID=176173 RepID=A0ABR4LRF1_9EURO
MLKLRLPIIRDARDINQDPRRHPEDPVPRDFARDFLLLQLVHGFLLLLVARLWLYNRVCGYGDKELVHF